MVTIFTHAHKRPDFIEMQYNSIKKHVKCDYEYIVLNNAIDSPDLSQQIESICSNLKIKTVKITLLEELKSPYGATYYVNSSYIDACAGTEYPMIWLFKKYLTNEKKICIIDSDMFFINDIDLDTISSNKDLIYIPQYRANGTAKYIWNAFLVANLERNPNLKNLNWCAHFVNGDKCDVGGQTHFDLLEYKPESKYIEEYSLREINIDNNKNIKIHYIQNGNVNYFITLNSDKNLIEFKHIGGFKLFKEKSFPHEIFNEPHEFFILNKNIKMISYLEKYNLSFPNPSHIGFIGFPEENDFFIIHYKSGSNYLEFSTEEYNKQKTKQVKKLLDLNFIKYVNNGII